MKKLSQQRLFRKNSRYRNNLLSQLKKHSQLATITPNQKKNLRAENLEESVICSNKHLIKWF